MKKEERGEGLFREPVDALAALDGDNFGRHGVGTVGVGGAVEAVLLEVENGSGAREVGFSLHDAEIASIADEELATLSLDDVLTLTG